MMDKAVKYLEKVPQGTLLDCSCGDGSFTMEIARRIGTDSICGIETNKMRCEKARDKGVIVYDADLNQSFPLADECTDVVTADGVIEHLVNLDNFITEIYRVLRLQGYAVIGTENLAATHNIFVVLCGNQPYSGPTLSKYKVIGHHPIYPNFDVKEENLIPEHTKVIAFKTLRQLFEVYGFERSNTTVR